MKKTNVFVLTLITALLLSACGAPPENKPANTTNTNTAKPVAAAPTTDVLLDMERKAHEAYAKGDGAYFEGLLSEKAVMSKGKENMGKAAIIAGIKTAKCEMTDGVKLSEPQMAKVDNDTYAFVYRNDTEGKCTERGKSVAMKPMRNSTIWVRNGEKWQAAWHSETEIVEPKQDPKKEEVKKEDAKKEDAKKADAAKADSATADVAKADVAKDAIKKAEVKKDDAKKEVAKKEEPKKEDAKPAAPVAAPEKPVASANTDALVKIHQAGWEAWKNKDAKWFDQNTTSTLAFVDPIGKWFGNKADVIRQWTEGMKCEGVTKVSVTDGFGFALSPTVEVLLHKGTADGKCDGEKNAPLWATAVYVKEGSDWKLSFLFESPAM